MSKNTVAWTNSKSKSKDDERAAPGVSSAKVAYAQKHCRAAFMLTVTCT